MFTRIADFSNKLSHKGFFLFGPRLTGKSTYLKKTFPNALYIDLLKPSTFREISSTPEGLEEQIRFHLKHNPNEPVIIDEIQKYLEILDEIHRLIEAYKDLRFILTGSSARKLKRSGVNLLAGRLHWNNFFPITTIEAKTSEKDKKSWEDLISIGGLPSILTSPDPFSDLKDYIGLYLQEEIQAEGLSRSIGNFSRFLDVAALCNAEQINFTSIGNDAQIAPRTIYDYFKIIEDTLIGTMVPCYQKTKKRKPVSSAKFYFFDVGITNQMLGRKSIKAGTMEYGKALEHLVFCELKAYIGYIKKDCELYYWRTNSQKEVDFIIVEDNIPKVAIEVKGAKNLRGKDFSGLEAFSEEYVNVKKIVVSLDENPKETENGITILPAEEFFKGLWEGKVF